MTDYDELKKAWDTIIDFCKNQTGCYECPYLYMGCNWDMNPSEWTRFYGGKTNE